MYTRENQNPEWSSLRPMSDPSCTQPDSLLYRPRSALLPDRPRFALLPDRPRSALLPDRPSSVLLSYSPGSGLLPDQPSSALLPERPRSAFPFPPDRSAGTYLADGTITAVPHPGSVASKNMVTARNHYQDLDRDPSSTCSMLDSSSVVNKRCNSDSSFKPASAATAIDPDDVQARLLKLQNETGYDIIQRHGQRIYGGPPPGWQGEFPGKGTEVYCYRLPRDCFEDELVPIFSQVGQIFELRLMIEFSGTNRTYCYVRYTKMDHAMEAIRSLDGYEIRTGQHLAVSKSVDNRRIPGLFVEHGPYRSTEGTRTTVSSYFYVCTYPREVIEEIQLKMRYFLAMPGK